MFSLERIRLRINRIIRILFAKKRNRDLKIKDFSIISNNCWGGMIYESYNLIKSSPTIGAYFFAPEYIKFLGDLKGYINGNITFIRKQDSKYYNIPSYHNFNHNIIGLLSNGVDSVEIEFLHYKSEQEVIDKWNRRRTRINYNKLIIKYNDQNNLTEKDLIDYIKCPLKNKLFFTSRNWNNDLLELAKNHDTFIKKINCFPRNSFIMTSLEPYGKKITNYINEL